MPEDVGIILAQQSNNTADAISQLGRKGEDFSTLPVFYRDQLEIGIHRVKESIRIDEGSFILGHPEYGILGSDTLGSNGSDFILQHVYNDIDEFPEGFWNDRFIDDSLSTGSLNTGSENYTLNPSEILHTLPIAKEDKLYKTALINITSIYADSGSDANDYLLAYASNDGNNTYQPLTIGTETNITGGDTSGLTVKIVNNAVGTPLTMPVTMPISFGAVKDIILNEFKVKYS